MNFTVDPRANDVAAALALFNVAALVLSAAWLKTNDTPGVTVYVAVPVLPLESVTVTVVAPCGRLEGIVA